MVWRDWIERCRVDDNDFYDWNNRYNSEFAAVSSTVMCCGVGLSCGSWKKAAGSTGWALIAKSVSW